MNNSARFRYNPRTGRALTLRDILATEGTGVEIDAYYHATSKSKAWMIANKVAVKAGYVAHSPEAQRNRRRAYDIETTAHEIVDRPMLEEGTS